METEELTKGFETRLGTFVMRRESAMDQLKIGRRRRALLEGNDADALDWNFAHQMAGIDILAEVKPEKVTVDAQSGFINWDRVLDLNAIMKLWQDYQEWENSFLDPDGESEDTGASSE
jgi:hypothetical protein